MYDPQTSILAGRDTSLLRADLNAAQQAYIDLSSGNKGQDYSYAQGDGQKRVVYTRANMGDLVILIRQLQAQLGIIAHPRRALSPRF